MFPSFSLLSSPSTRQNTLYFFLCAELGESKKKKKTFKKDSHPSYCGILLSVASFFLVPFFCPCSIPSSISLFTHTLPHIHPHSTLTRPFRHPSCHPPSLSLSLSPSLSLSVSLLLSPLHFSSPSPKVREETSVIWHTPHTLQARILASHTSPNAPHHFISRFPKAMESMDCSSPSCSPALSDLPDTHPLSHARNNATTRSSDSLCTTASSSSSTSVTFKSNEHLGNPTDLDQDEDEQVEREQEEQGSPIHTQRRAEEEEDDEEQTDSTMDDDEVDTINSHTHTISMLQRHTQLEQQQNQHSGDQRYPSIPSELILHIFRFLIAPQDLRAAILVCKLWCSCGVDMLWSRPHLLSMTVVSRMIQTMSAPDTMFPYPRYIRRLNFSFLTQDLTDASLTGFTCCSRLERLLLPGSTKTTRAGLEAILANCSALYSLDLSEVTAVDDALVQYIAQHCPRLHTLYLASCPTITDDAIVSLAKNCRSLKRVSVSLWLLSLSLSFSFLWPMV